MIINIIKNIALLLFGYICFAMLGMIANKLYPNDSALDIKDGWVIPFLCIVWNVYIGFKIIEENK